MFAAMLWPQITNRSHHKQYSAILNAKFSRQGFWLHLSLSTLRKDAKCLQTQPHKHGHWVAYYKGNPEKASLLFPSLLITSIYTGNPLL